MNLTELEILFHQKISEVHPRFKEESRPESFYVANYLNKAIREFIQQRLLDLPSFEQRISALDIHQDEFSNLIVGHKELTDNVTVNYVSSGDFIINYNWSGRSKRYQVPSDMMIPISLACKHTRTEVYPYSDQRVFAQFVSRKQAERIVSDPANKAIFVRPIAFIDDKYYIMLIGDAYTTALSSPYLTYLKEPFELSHEFTRLSSSTSTLTISAITDGSYFRMLSPGEYVNSVGAATTYRPGDKVLKVAGYPTISQIDTNRDIEVGYPYNYTDTPEFPEFMHDLLLERSVMMFLEEGNLKLVSKQQTQ